jgi:hypothetical protein
VAQKQMGTFPSSKFPNSLRAIETGSSTAGLSSPGTFSNLTGLRNALSTFDAFTYTTAVLDQMTVNDMIFAYRNIGDPTTIANYIPAQTARVS